MIRFTAAAAAVAACLLPSWQATGQVRVVTLSSWSKQVGDALDRQLEYPRFLDGRMIPTGTVWVKFNCSESGSPDKVTLRRSSGNRMLDRAALAAVSHIPTLHPLPEGIGHDQAYEAVLLFATDQLTHDRQMQEIRAEVAKRNAWLRQPSVEVSQKEREPILLAGL